MITRSKFIRKTGMYIEVTASSKVAAKDDLKEAVEAYEKHPLALAYGKEDKRGELIYIASRPNLVDTLNEVYKDKEWYVKIGKTNE